METTLIQTLMRKSSNLKSGRTSESALCPVIGRKVLSKTSTSTKYDLLYDNNGNKQSETILVDASGVSESNMTPECPNVNISKTVEVLIATKTEPHGGLKKCPRNSSDPESTYVKCAKYSQEWLNNCCNLSGISQNAIKKLAKLQCP